MPPGRGRPYGTARPPPGGRHAPRHVRVGATHPGNHRVETDDGVPGCVALRRRDGALPEGEHDGSPHVAPRARLSPPRPLCCRRPPNVGRTVQCAHSGVHTSSEGEHAIRIGGSPAVAEMALRCRAALAVRTGEPPGGRVRRPSLHQAVPLGSGPLDRGGLAIAEKQRATHSDTAVLCCNGACPNGSPLQQTADNPGAWPDAQERLTRSASTQR